MSNLKVQVGQTVQYIGIEDQPKAAVITKINSNGTVSLTIFADDDDDPDGQQLLRAVQVPQYVDTFDMRKVDQSHSFKVIR